MEEVKGSIHSFETFGSVDGPGVRFVVFMNGCNLRCQYCHNRDTWTMKDETMSVDELLNKALRYKSYWKENGGITISGGEPLLQMDFLIAFAKKAKQKGIHICIDTSGNPFTREEPFFSKIEELLPLVDLFLLDIKHIDNQKHIALTSQPNTNIKEFAMYLSQKDKPVWIRHVLVPTINDSDEDLNALATFVQSLHNVQRFEVLPYHTFGIFKWQDLGYEYPLKDVDEPSSELLAHANELLHTLEYQAYLKK
ncbi:MAG: pyruvate formate-lyase-activating protein [Longicatena sp.]